MSDHRVSLRIVDERPNVHPLHISIDPDHADKIGLVSSYSEQCFIAGLSSNILSKTIFVYVRIENLPDSAESPNGDDGDMFRNGLVLACTRRFLDYYNLWIFCDNNRVTGLLDSIERDEPKPLIFFRIIQALELSRIVIAVKNDRVYRWAQNTDFKNNLLRAMSQGPVLARVNDVLLAPYSSLFFSSESDISYHFNMIALECSPYAQGIITGNTEIVLTITTDPEIFTPSYFRSSSRDDELTSSCDESDLPNVLPKDQILLSKYKHVAGRINRNNPQVKFSVVPKAALWSRILAKTETSSQFDEMYRIGFPKSLMVNHELFDGDLIKVCLKSNMLMYSDKHDDTSNIHMKKCNWRIAQVKMMKKDFDQTTLVFINPLVYFNLISSVPWHHQILFFQKCEKKPPDIPTASEVQVSLITSPEHSGKTTYNRLLKQYFSRKRMVSVGDVISLNSQDDADVYQNLTEEIKYRQPVIHFRVIHIDPAKSEAAIFWVTQATTLIQVQNVQSYAPTCMWTYLSHGEELSYFEKPKLHGLQNYVDKLSELIEPYLHISSNPGRFKGDNIQPTVLVCGCDGSGKTSVVSFVARSLHLHLYSVNCQRLCSDSQSVTEAKLRNIFTAATGFAPCVLLMENVHMLGKDRDGHTDDPRVAKSFAAFLTNTTSLMNKYPVIIVATSRSPHLIAHDIIDCFLHTVTLETPSESERTEMISGLVADLPLTCDVDVSYISNRTAGFVLGDFLALMSQVGKQALRHITKLFSELSRQEEADIKAAGVLLQQNDFVEALDVLQSAHSDSMGTPKIPNVKWQDIGGLSHIKSDILDTIQLPLRYPKLLAAGLKRSGILLYGPPGTGKTLLAKAVATECSLNFLSVKGPELINQYVGQSEENVRNLFTRARDASPCVIFFDELDSLAPNRGRSGDSGGVMDRVVSQLLSEVDGLHRSAEVFVIGATNRPDLLDPALLRPGRFDKLLYLGVSEDRPSQLKIIKALTRKFHLSDDVDLSAICDLCPLNLTGADLYALCSDAMLNAIKRKVAQLKLTDVYGTSSSDSTVIVTSADFTSALNDLTPSVSDEEILRYKQLQQTLSPVVH